MKKELTASQQKELISILKERFEKNMSRHKGLIWNEVQLKLEKSKEKLWSLNEMEISGGEPDVVYPIQIENNKKNDEYYFIDCSAESPKGRRSICYDHEALEARKEHKPENSAIEMAKDMGIEILNESLYRALQQYGKFDTKTSSWILTPAPIRKLAGAIFADYRYGTIFIYHNGAESYYAARGFRGFLKV